MNYDRRTLGGFRLPAETSIEPRLALRLAIRSLAHERGDIRALTGDLKRFCRLRIKTYRVIFKYKMTDSQRTATCVFSGGRRWVYEVFQRRLGET